MKCKECPNFEKLNTMWAGLGMCTNEENDNLIVYDYNECTKENEKSK